MPRPRITARGASIAAACWALYAVLYASVITASEAAPFAGVLIGQLISAGVLAALSVPAWLLVVRRMDRTAWGWKVGAHALIAPLYAFAGMSTYLWITRLGAGADVAARVGERRFWILLSYVVLYALQFALYHAARALQRLRRKEREAAHLAALARERELAALKAQVNPHFLFNTLNSVSAAVKRDPEAARAMLEQLAGLLRYAMGREDPARKDPVEGGKRRDAPSEALVTLGDELAFARRYLALESHRFGDRLAVHFDVDEATLGTKVPPMTLQPLVENAVRHGIAPLEAGGTVTVRVGCASGGRVRIAIEDTGAGLDGTPPENGRGAVARATRGTTALPESTTGGGTGLQNTSARLRRTFGPEAHLYTDENDPHGFRVWFSVPAARHV